MFCFMIVLRGCALVVGLHILIDLYFAMGAQVIQRGIISSTQRCYFISLLLWFALKNDSVNFCVIFISTLLLLVSWKKIPSSRLSTFHEIESATRTNVKKWLDHNNLLIFSPGIRSAYACQERTAELILAFVLRELRRFVSFPIRIFVDSAPCVLQELRRIYSRPRYHTEVLEADGLYVLFIEREFTNWGKTVETKSKIVTFFPKTKEGICNIVIWAKSKKLNVRAAGFRHSWSNITIDNESQVLVSMLPYDLVGTFPIFIPKMDKQNELQGIELLNETIVDEDGIEKRLCKIGAGTSNEHFREWVVKNSLDDKTMKWKPWWVLPFNVIMVENTFGGTNAPICHGAGRTTATMSDLVVSIEFVNSMGELQMVDDPDQLKSASGCFGMLGVVTAITMKLDPLTFARMMPKKKRLALTIPPPKGFQIPQSVDMSGITPPMLEQAFEEFKDICECDYYAEFFWYPNHKNCWINSWKNDGIASDARQYPRPCAIQIQEASLFLNEIMNRTIFRLLPPYYQMTFFSSLAMYIMPTRNGSNPIVAPVSDAIHFRHGIHNMRVHSMEWEIPIPGLKSDPFKPDWSVCQKAWWVAIKCFYDRFEKDKNDVPMRLPLEMRITGGSKVNLAPQFGNTNGTCSVEILTTENVNRDEWRAFMQDITDAWTNLTNADGETIHPFKNEKDQLLYVRPHWAKHWEGLNVHEKPIKQYLREEAFKDQLVLYRQDLAAAAEAKAYTLEDAEQVFSTKFSAQMFGDGKH